MKILGGCNNTDWGDYDDDCGIFKGCIQLSSLPDLSKWNNNYFNHIFKSLCLIINFPLKINKYLFYLINY